MIRSSISQKKQSAIWSKILYFESSTSYTAIITKIVSKYTVTNVREKLQLGVKRYNHKMQLISDAWSPKMATYIAMCSTIMTCDNY